jgi:hypothetical protein
MLMIFLYDVILIAVSVVVFCCVVSSVVVGYYFVCCPCAVFIAVNCCQMRGFELRRGPRMRAHQVEITISGKLIDGRLFEGKDAI